jgi:hypothetical protein
MADRDDILNTIISAIPLNRLNSGELSQIGELYIPPAHRKALELNSNLVIGARGVGKSTWTTALSKEDWRSEIGLKIKELENADVRIGFSENKNINIYPTMDVFVDIIKNFDPYLIWKAIFVRWLCEKINETIPSNTWKESVQWVRENSESWARIIERGNIFFKSNNKNGLILFDALDRTSTRWEEMDTIVQALLRLVLEMKSFSNIHGKVFLREDQYSRNVTSFPDASKLMSTRTELDWVITDLHGLLWQTLCNAENEGGQYFRSIYKDIVGTVPQEGNNYWTIHDDVKRKEDLQRRLFEKLAGPWMGKDRRKGIPYLWTVGHLADGNGRTSPRSFLNLIGSAAEKSLHLNRGGEYPLNYESIKRSVQKASELRVNEMAEDYPWVKEICKSLQGKNVPIDFNEVKKLWTQKYPNGPDDIQSEKLPPQDKEKGWDGIKEELIRIGVFAEMRDGRINMPDLYRVGFGLGRKGGVPPINKRR